MTAVDSDIDSFIRQQKTKLATERQVLNLREPNSNVKDTVRRKWGPPVDPNVLQNVDKDDYKRTWYELKGQFLEPSHSQRQEDTTVKLSPRGVLDTNSLILEVQKEKEREEYLERWQRAHGQQLKPAAIDEKRPEVSRFDDTQKNIENRIAEAKQEASDHRKRWHTQHQKPEVQGSRFQNHGVLIGEDNRLEKMRQLREERKREYNEYLARKKAYQRQPLQEQTDEYKTFVLGDNESDAVKLQKIKERNEDYNQFLMTKHEKDKNRFADKKLSEDGRIFATIPGLRYSTSAQKRDMAAERNKEYNQLLRLKAQDKMQRGGDGQRPPDVPREGWSSPTYEEVLDQKRIQEGNYRRANDMGYESNLPTQDALQANLLREQRMRELQRDLATESPIAFAPAASELAREHTNVLSRLKNIEDNLQNLQDPALRGPQISAAPLSYQAVAPQDNLGFGTPIFDMPSEHKRKKEEYRKELQRQMMEAKLARRREKEEGLPANTTGLKDRDRPPVTHVVYGGRESNRRDPAVEAYHTKILDSLHKLDEMSPSNLTSLGNNQSTGNTRGLRGLGLNTNLNSNQRSQPDNRGSGGPLLDLEVAPILQPARLASLDPPPGLQYQPSTYVTANVLPNMNNSVDEAYTFYANHNPLDTYISTGGPSVGQAGGREFGGAVPVPSLDLSKVGRDGGPTSRVRFRDGRQAEAPANGLIFSSDEERKQKQRQQQSVYREDLERQMLEKNFKKRQEKEAQERFDIKMEEEAKSYDPFGKGGGGAPMRDPAGNIISDLRQMRFDNNNRENNITTRARDVSPVAQAGNNTRAATSYRDDLIGPPPAQTTTEGEATFARGGHGIFGMPKTETEKLQADKYKIELMRQMEEKRADEYRKRQLERLEEEREQKILDEQRAKMQREFEEEQRRIKEKEEEARRRNEEMIRAVEEKKREVERRRREAEEQRERELREERERDNRDREPQRGASPPVPAVRTKTAIDMDHLTQDFFPRRQSSDVLNQLAHMRAQLQTERRRVQTMLHDREDDVEISDPRLEQKPPQVPLPHPRPDFDVFETAMNRNAVAVRRTPADQANRQAAEDFNALKHKKDSDSRKQFRKLFPEDPITAEALEVQQAMLLKQQEEKLHNFRGRRTHEHLSPAPPARDTHSSSSQLQSKSAFVEVNGLGHFPDDFEDFPRRNDSARSRRRNRDSPSLRVSSAESRSGLGSQTSLNIDKLARNNEDRLRKLRELQGDDLSLNDPEDVLERFMSKQGHNRPPSGNTLLDDTWMKTGDKRPR